MADRCNLSLLFIILTAILLISPVLLSAAIIVDPNGTGEDDVYPADPATWTSSSDSVIGSMYDGALLVDADSDLLSYNSTIGLAGGANGSVTVSGIGSTWLGLNQLQVGQQGNGKLNIVNGGAVSSYEGSISHELGSTGFVTIDGLGSTWTNSSNLYVGRSRIGEMEIFNGATVQNGYDGIIAHLPGSSGTVTVDGLGSTWTNSVNLYVGDTGEGYLNIEGGGTVQNDFDGIIGNQPSASGIVKVDGIGSTWNNGGYLYVGKGGSGTLDIKNGANVNSSNGHVGYLPSATGIIKVDGPLSTWTNSDSLHVGEFGYAELEITRGATVSNHDGVIAYESSATGIVTVDGPLSRWTNTGSLTVGREGSAATLNITNHGTVSTAGLSIGPNSELNLDGGTLELTGTMEFGDWQGAFYFNRGEIKVSNGTVTDLSGTTLVGHHTLTLTGNNAHWISNNPFVLGYPVGVPSIDNAGSTLNIAEGASLSSPAGTIGANPEAASNATVRGTGSTWSNSGELTVSNGTLNIISGGSVSDISATIGVPNSTGSVTVDGIGSTWTSQNSLKVGNEGNGSLDITNGGTVTSSSLLGSMGSFIGFEQGATGRVTVDGVGSTWNSAKEICVGCSGSGTLEITNGGTVNGNNCSNKIGYNPSSTGSVIVDGIGSTWNSGKELNVGIYGNGTIQITGGGTVNSDNLDSVSNVIGVMQGSSGTVTVQGNGSAWNNRGNLFVGALGTGAFHISDGAKANSTAIYIAGSHYATSSVTVDGNGSTLDSTVFLKVGYQGNGTLDITDGGTVHSGNLESESGLVGGFIGYNTGSTGTVIVDGEDSTWNIQGDFKVGFEGSGTLNITNGGIVNSENPSSNNLSVIAHGENSSGTVLIDGDGSTWNNRGRLYIGSMTSIGSSATLRITNGGALHCKTSYTSPYPWTFVSQGSSILVDGTGSTWTNSSGLRIGNNGTRTGATLDITGGGLVRSGDDPTIPCTSFIDYGSTVTVDGIDSAWINQGTLSIGAQGDSISTLNITDGGTVTTSCLTFGTSANLNLDGGTLELIGDMNFYSLTEKFNFVGGEIKVTNGFINVQQTVSLGENQTLTVTGQGADLSTGSSFFIDGGTLAIKNGGSVDSYMDTSIGYTPGHTGTVVVDGIDENCKAPAIWHNNRLEIGHEGNGFLDIINGGMVYAEESIIGYAPGSTGTVIVDGVGENFNIIPTNWSNIRLEVGHEGNGVLDITNGGIVQAGEAIIGYALGSTGVVTVEGANSMWEVSHLTVSDKGDGRLNIANGGLVYVIETTQVGSGNGTIHFDGGTLDTGSLEADDVNLTGTGTILLHDRIVDNTVVLDSPDGLVGLYRTINSEPDQNITVNWNIYRQSKVGAGNTGTGSLTISQGLTVPSRYGYIGRYATATGTVTVDGSGSTWNNNASLYVGLDGNGTLNIVNGGTVRTTTGYLGYGSDSIGTVTVDGTGSAWVNSGNLYVGDNGSATLQITGRGLVSVAGTLTIDDDTDGDAFINISTCGMLALFGEADHSLASFLDLIEGTDAINYWDSSIADWADITGATLGTDYTLEYLTDGDLAGYTLLTVQTVAAIPGDANGDGRVDGSDVTILAGNWQFGVGDGQTATWTMGDFNRDGKVDGSDATLLAGNWQYGVTKVAASVPEPSSITALLLTAFLLLVRFCRLR